MLPEDEQVYHTYLTDLPSAEPSVKLLDAEYMEGRLTLQVRAGCRRHARWQARVMRDSTFFFFSRRTI
jgi:hypothetical protein